MEQRPPPSKSHASGITAIHWLPPWEPTYSAVQVAVTGRQSTAPRGVSSSLIREVSAEATPGRYQLRSSAAQPPNQEAPERPEGLSPQKSKFMPSCSGVEAVVHALQQWRVPLPRACTQREIDKYNKHSVTEALEETPLCPTSDNPVQRISGSLQMDTIQSLRSLTSSGPCLGL